MVLLLCGSPLDSLGNAGHLDACNRLLWQTRVKPASQPPNSLTFGATPLSKAELSMHHPPQARLQFRPLARKGGIRLILRPIVLRSDWFKSICAMCVPCQTNC